MKTLFRGWPIMAHNMHTRRRVHICDITFVHCLQSIFAIMSLLYNLHIYNNNKKTEMKVSPVQPQLPQQYVQTSSLTERIRTRSGRPDPLPELCSIISLIVQLPARQWSDSSDSFKRCLLRASRFLHLHNITVFCGDLHAMHTCMYHCKCNTLFVRDFHNWYYKDMTCKGLNLWPSALPLLLAYYS